jgi:hypothetical protein
MKREKPRQAFFLYARILSILVMLLAFACLLVFRYIVRGPESIDEEAYAPISSSGALFGSIMRDRPGNNVKGLNRQIVVLYDISRDGTFSADLTSGLNEFLLSLLFDPPDSLEKKLPQDQYSYMENRLSECGISQPLVSEDKRVGVTLAYTGIIAKEMDRLNSLVNGQQGIAFDDYVNRLIKSYLSSRDRFHTTNLEMSAEAVREQILSELPSRRSEFVSSILPLPTFSLPFSPRAVYPNHFAAETIIVRVSAIYSGSSQNRLGEDLSYIASRYRNRFREEPLKELYSQYAVSESCFLISHNRPETYTSVYIEVFRLQPPDILRDFLAFSQSPIQLSPHDDGYQFASEFKLENLDRTGLANIGLELDSAEWHPTVEANGRLYELRDHLTSDGSMIPFSGLPNPYWDYRFRGFALLVGRYNAHSNFGLSLPVIVSEEWDSEIAGKPKPGYPRFPLLALPFGGVIAIGLALLAISLVERKRVPPYMKLSDEHPSTHKLYADPQIEHRYWLIANMDLANRTEMQARFFVCNAGGRGLKVALWLENMGEYSQEDYEAWQVKLRENILKVRAHGRKLITVNVDGSALPIEERNVLKKLIIQPANIDQSALEVVLDLRATGKPISEHC